MVRHCWRALAPVTGVDVTTQEDLAHLIHLRLQMRAARDLAHHHPHEIGVVSPRAQQDLDHPEQLLVCGLQSGRGRVSAEADQL